MKKTALLCALLALTASTSFAKDWNEIRLASEGAFPPFNIIAADGSLQGFDIDIGNALCEEMKAKCTWVKQDWDGMIPALVSRKFDAILASMSITEERKAKVDFTQKYYASPLALIAKKGSPLQPDLFRPVVDSLLREGDRWMVLADYRSYANAQREVAKLYRSRELWLEKSILNTAGMGYFSSDRAVAE